MKEALSPIHSVKTIKRYQNRKLYDTETSSYVTLEDIALMIKTGKEVKIIDNKTKQDLTTLTLSQIIFEEQKKHKSLLPLDLLRRMIQSPAESLSDLFEYLSENIHTVSHLKEEADRYLQKFKGGEEENQSKKESSSLTGILSVPQKNFDLLQKKIDEQIRFAFSRISGFDALKQEVSDLGEKLSDLDRRLTAIERKLKNM